MQGGGGFEYVDFASKALSGFRNRVVRLPEVRSLARRYANTDCFCTYFPFDRGLAEHVKGNGHSVSGYAGPYHATCVSLHFRSLCPDCLVLITSLRACPARSFCLSVFDRNADASPEQGSSRR